MNDKIYITLFTLPVTIMLLWLILRGKQAGLYIPSINTRKEKNKIIEQVQRSAISNKFEDHERRDASIINKKVYMKILAPFKKLPLGYYRLMIVGWIVLPLSVAGIAYALNTGWGHDPEGAFVGTLIFGIPIYYVLARFGVWIYDGFTQNNANK